MKSKERTIYDVPEELAFFKQIFLMKPKSEHAEIWAEIDEIVERNKSPFKKYEIIKDNPHGKVGDVVGFRLCDAEELLKSGIIKEQ